MERDIALCIERILQCASSVKHFTLRISFTLWVKRQYQRSHTRDLLTGQKSSVIGALHCGKS
jgi:hypothetical protein